MTWKDITLGVGLRVKHGFAFKGEHFVSDGQYVVLTPGNFHEIGGFRPRPGKDRFYDGDIPEDYILHEGDLIVAMTEQGEGLLGSSALIPESNKYLHNQRLGLIDEIKGDVFDKKFLFYLFNTRSVRGQISGSASGTKVKHTAPERIYRVRVRVPDVNSQKNIAQTLRAYDELIGNNRRRIELLDQSAKLLFKEWFVYLRYPGHEHDTIVDGVPKKWTLQVLGDIVENFDRNRKPLSVLEREQRPGKYPYHGAAGILGRIDGFLFDGRYLLVGEDGTVATAQGTPMLQLVQGQFWVSNHAHVLQGGLISTGFAYCFLSQYQIGGHVTGVAQPKLTQANLNRISVLVPGEVLRNSFEEIIAPIIDQIFALRAEISKLEKARDLLLPRLMDGRLGI